jgi:hypothetical protein
MTDRGKHVSLLRYVTLDGRREFYSSGSMARAGQATLEFSNLTSTPVAKNVKQKMGQGSSF